jgi:hypothetical protein
MPFEKHKGKRIDSVPMSYLHWLSEQEWLVKWPDVYNYIVNSQDVIRRSAGRNYDTVSQSLRGSTPDPCGIA